MSRLYREAGALCSVEDSGVDAQCFRRDPRQSVWYWFIFICTAAKQYAHKHTKHQTNKHQPDASFCCFHTHTHTHSPTCARAQFMCNLLHTLTHKSCVMLFVHMYSRAWFCWLARSSRGARKIYIFIYSVCFTFFVCFVWVTVISSSSLIFHFRRTLHICMSSSASLLLMAQRSVRLQ